MKIFLDRVILVIAVIFLTAIIIAQKIKYQKDLGGMRTVAVDCIHFSKQQSAFIRGAYDLR
jgi:hypothetical protein